jgi:hypothetical protein
MNPADPRRRCPPHPVVDECSGAVLDEAVLSLSLLRCPMLVGDAGAELHALMSLAAHISSRIPDAVTAAREQLVPWSVIGAQLGLSAAVTRRRYGHSTEAARRWLDRAGGPWVVPAGRLISPTDHRHIPDLLARIT